MKNNWIIEYWAINFDKDMSNNEMDLPIRDATRNQQQRRRSKIRNYNLRRGESTEEEGK